MFISFLFYTVLPISYIFFILFDWFYLSARTRLIACSEIAELVLLNDFRLNPSMIAGTNMLKRDKEIAEELDLDDRIEESSCRDSFITLKDHKPYFINEPTYRLINPSKSEIGIIKRPP